MANGRDDAKAAADEVSRWTNDDDGVVGRCSELLADGALRAGGGGPLAAASK